MPKFLLWSCMVLVVVILIIWVRRTYIEHKINKSIEAYGIPKSEITKTTYGYNFTSGYYEKYVFTKQDGEDKYYMFEYRHMSGRKKKSSTLIFSLW